MEPVLREVIGNVNYYQIPPRRFLIPESIYLFDETYVHRFSTIDQIWFLIFGNFPKFLLSCEFCFWQIIPP